MIFIWSWNNYFFFRLILAPVKLRAVMSMSESAPVTTGHVSAGYAELDECIREKSNHSLGAPYSIQVKNSTS